MTCLCSLYDTDRDWFAHHLTKRCVSLNITPVKFKVAIDIAYMAFHETGSREQALKAGHYYAQEHEVK